MHRWIALRIAALVAMLLGGLLADWGWTAFAGAWFGVALGLAIWSVCENEIRP